MDEVRQIDKCSVVDTAITEGSNFVGDSGLNWKPVKGYKMLCDVGGFGETQNETGGTVLNSLETIQKIIGGTYQEGVAIL